MDFFTFSPLQYFLKYSGNKTGDMSLHLNVTLKSFVLAYVSNNFVLFFPYMIFFKVFLTTIYKYK